MYIEGSSVATMDELLDAVDMTDAGAVKKCLDDGEFQQTDLAKALTRCLTAETLVFEVMKVILEYGTDPNVPGARRKIYTKKYQRRNNGDYVIDTSRTFSSMYPLLIASQRGFIQGVQFLLAYEADVDIVDNVTGFTALYTAVLQLNLELIKLLLENGAQPNKKVINMTPFTFILNNMHNEKTEEILCMMLDHGANANVSISLSAYSSINSVPALMSLINTSTKPETVKQMITRTANIDARDANRMSAIHKASAIGRADLVRILIQYGTSPDLDCGFDGRTSLMIAASYGHSDVTKVLIEAGADLQANDLLGRSVISYAVAGNSIGCVASLLLHNVKFHEIDHKLPEVTKELNIRSDLMTFACYVTKNEAAVRILYLAGADIEIVRRCTVTTSDAGNEMLSCPKIKSFLCDILAEVIPLRQQCRTTIRKQLSNEIQTEIEKLPTASIIRHYILIPELKEYLV